MSGEDEVVAAIEGAVIVFPAGKASRQTDATTASDIAGAEREANDPMPQENMKNVLDPALDGKGGGDSLPPSDGDDAPRFDDGGPRSLEEINENHAVVLLGSRAVVMRESAVGPIEDRVKVMSVEAFKTRYAHCTIRRVSRRKNDAGEWEDTVSYVKLAPAWISWPPRRTFDGVEFYPDADGKPGTEGYFNFWRGFGCAPDPAPPEEREKKYSVFRDHILTNICNGDKELDKWVWAWIAHLVQRPRKRIGTAIVLRGKMGVGKTVLGDVIGSLFPSHYFLVDSSRYLVGQFNAHMASCLLLQVDEGYWAGDKGAEGRLKSLITADKQMIEAKGVDPIRLDNYVRLLFTSNESWVVPAGMDERRFAVFDVAAHCKENHEYFAELYGQIANGGREALLADLLAYDLDAADAPNVRVIPKTEALLEQKIRSLEDIPQWLYGRLVDGAQTHRKSKWEHIVAIRTVYADFIRWAERLGRRRKPSDAEFGIALKKLLPNLAETRRKVEVEDAGDDERPIIAVKRVRCYEFPTLDDCRSAFEELLRQPIHWGPPVDGGDDSTENSDGHGLDGP